MRKVVFTPNNFYHIYNRGVDKRNVFVDDNDRWRFLQGLFLFNDADTSSNLLWELEKSRKGANFTTIKEYFFGAEKRSRQPIVRIMADCLMPNHYHLLIEELRENGITKFMHKLGTGYTRFFNEKYKGSGSLFQGRYKSIEINSNEYLLHLSSYVNLNYEIHGLSSSTTKSSWNEYLGKVSGICNKEIILSQFKRMGEYEKFALKSLETIKQNKDMEKLLLESLGSAT